MFYSDVITLVSSQVRDAIAWPNDSSKLQDQINEVFTATLALAREVPLPEIHLSPASATPLVTGTTLKRADLPDDIFDGRPDHGIISLDFDGNLFTTSEALPHRSLILASSNTYQSGNVLFSILDKTVYFINATVFTVTYVPLFIKPTTVNYNTIDFPLYGNSVDAVVALVASRVSAVQARDVNAATIHSQFANRFGVNHG